MASQENDTGLAFEPISELDLPPVSSLISALEDSAPSAPARDEPLDSSEQEHIFRALQRVLYEAEKAQDVQEHRASNEQPDLAVEHREKRLAQEGVVSSLEKLWKSKSQYMAQASEALANASRDPSWRVPFGRSCVLTFFLRIAAAKEQVENEILFHSLRLIGNTCADTDENRQIVVENNYTLPIIRHMLNPGLVHVAIPVIYNICADFEQAQSQVAANRIVYILLKLISENAVQADAVLNYAYELIELASEKDPEMENSPTGTILLLMHQSLNKDTEFSQYACLVNSLTTYLQSQRLQAACIQHKLVDQLLAILRRSYTIPVDESSTEDKQLLNQLRLKLNQALSDVSALPEFGKTYPFSSELMQTLRGWLTAESQDHLQICACVMLGNLARDDATCRAMITELSIHTSLVAILTTPGARGGALHASLSFLKNLAIAEPNRDLLGGEGVIPAAAKLCALDSIPQVQFAAVSLLRLLITSSTANTARLLEPVSTTDQNNVGDNSTYLSLILTLHRKTDTVPIKTEAGRTVAAICRNLMRPGGQSAIGSCEETASSLIDRLFVLHPSLAKPLGSMVTQQEWPVVRSEGWFALALMASHQAGAGLVAACLEEADISEQLEKALSPQPSTGNENEEIQKRKDRDNVVVLVKNVLANAGDKISEERRERLQTLMKDAMGGLQEQNA